ncbi:MAG: hypothetical protein ABWY25_05395 [Paenisporosarcina sp.]
MNEPIDELYFNWLYAKVARHNVTTPSNRYQSLLYALHSTEFVWLVTGDDNRAQEGKNLRRDFFRESRITEPDDSWIFLDCSILEMMIALAQRLEFQTEDLNATEWFWTFLDNLGLSDISDAVYHENAYRIPQILDLFVWRLYDDLGRGGLFPLNETTHDQRKLELWYQFCEYVIDHDIS